MSCYNIQDTRIQFKYSTISGETPTIPASADHTDGTWTPTDLYVGEFFLNAEDNTMFIRTLSGIVPITSGTTTINTTAFVNKSGDTMTGQLNVPSLSATSISANTISSTGFTGTFVGDGSGLTGLTNTTFTGGTISGDTTFLGNVDFCSASISADTFNGCGAEITFLTDLNVTGDISGTTFYGDGSGLTNLPFTSGYTLDGVLTNGNTSANGDINLTNGDINLTNGIYYGDGSGLTNIPGIAPQSLDDVLAIGDTSDFGNIILTNGVFYGDGSGLTNVSGTTETLSDVLINGNETGNNWIDVSSPNYGIRSISQQDELRFASDRVLVGSSSGSSSSSISLFKNGTVEIVATNGVDGCEFTISDNGTTYLDGLSGEGIKYAADYSANFVNRSLVDKEYVDTAISAATPTLTLEDVLGNGNITNGNDILITSGDTIQFNQFNITEGYDNDLVQKRLDIVTSGNNPTNRISVYEGYGGIRFISDDDDDVRYSSYVINPYANGFETHDEDWDNSGKYLSSTFQNQPGSFTYTSSNNTDNKFVNIQANVQETNWFIRQEVSDNAGTFTFLNHTMEKIEVGSTSGLFSGLTYDSDYSSNYTNRSLVDKEYVDNSTSLTLEDVLVNGNIAGTNDIVFYNDQKISHYENSTLGLYYTEDPVSTDIKQTYIKGNAYGGFARVGIDNTNAEDLATVRLQTRYADGLSGADIFLNQADLNISMVTNSDGADFSQFDITPGEMTIINPSTANGTPGLQYASDYSATFTNRTLVDKEYVDNKFLSGLIDDNGTQIDQVRADISNGTGIFSEEIGGNDVSKVQVDVAQVTIQSAINGYTGTSVVDSEIVMRTTEEGTPGTTGYMKVEDGLFLQSKQTTYSEDTGYGSDDKLRVNEFIINKYIDQYSGTLDLFYEPFTQEDLMDYEVEVYMKNTDTYDPQRRYMVWKMKRSCVYNNYNVSYDISPTDTQKYDYGFNPAYDSWDIVRENDYPFGVKWRLDWDFGNYVDYSITIKLKVTTKKY